MRMLVMLCNSELVDDLLKVVDQYEVHGFSEIPNLRGSGRTGRHMGTRAFPGTISMVFTVVRKEKAKELIRAVRDWAATCPPGEAVRVFALDAEDVL